MLSVEEARGDTISCILSLHQLRKLSEVSSGTAMLTKTHHTWAFSGTETMVRLCIPRNRIGGIKYDHQIDLSQFTKRQELRIPMNVTHVWVKTDFQKPCGRIAIRS